MPGVRKLRVDRAAVSFRKFARMITVQSLSRGLLPRLGRSGISRKWKYRDRARHYRSRLSSRLASIIPLKYKKDEETISRVFTITE